MIKMYEVYWTESGRNRKIATVNNILEAWEEICENEYKQSPCIGKWDRTAWEEAGLQDDYPEFKWPDNIDYVWTADWLGEPVLNPIEYDDISIFMLMDSLMLSYKIEELFISEKDDEVKEDE